MNPAFRTSLLFRSLPIYQIYGANTGVGKTVTSTILSSAIRRHSPADRVLFLKPVSTGPLTEADHIHIDRYVKGVKSKCLYLFNEPVSPHIAARAQKRPCPSDSEICAAISKTVNGWGRSIIGRDRGIALIETAGGVLSPGPNSSLQADLYRPLRLPVILVADWKLGGISCTISAYESLSVRGYDVEAIVVFRDDYYRNHELLCEFAQQKRMEYLSIEGPPPRPPINPLTPSGEAAASNPAADADAMSRFYSRASEDPRVAKFLNTLETRHIQRIDSLESMADSAHKVIWYPFTQHRDLSASDITVIDSAHEDCFHTLKPASPIRKKTSKAGKGSGDGPKEPNSLLQSTFDGSASWWTQGLGHANPELALTSAYAAGRYGHIIFAGTIHDPALSLAELLLRSSQNPRLQRVFFSDNGSTGMEVAVKMALRAVTRRYGSNVNGTQSDIGILGLRGSYHGDTMGAMDCSEPSTFNQKVEWYQGRGYWFDFPTVKMVKGAWTVSMPGSMGKDPGDSSRFPCLPAIFDLEARKNSDLASRYQTYIRSSLEKLAVQDGRRFGALIIEPVILGAGGMLFADPLFQRVLIDTVRENPQFFSGNDKPSSSTSWSGLPVIFDEVFTGIYRLGRRTASSFLGVHPDIVVNAKLLTGGLIPMSTTMASEEIFQAFEGPEKSDALLHGHSYTAHPIGCSVAGYSVRRMIEMAEQGAWSGFVSDWKREKDEQQGGPEVWSWWSRSLVTDLSFARPVESVFALGSLLGITLRDQAGTGGYTSTAAAGLQQALIKGNSGFNIHARVLGNVLYSMASMTSTREQLQHIEAALRKHLL